MATFHPTQTGSSIDSATQLGVASPTVTSLALRFHTDALGLGILRRDGGEVVLGRDGGDVVLGAAAAARGPASRRE